MSAPPCPICERSTEMERTETGAWVCRNPPCVYRRVLERVHGGGATEPPKSRDVETVRISR